jgi:hypothetical protein
MLKCLAGLLASLIAVQPVAAAETETAPAADEACIWGYCWSEKETIAGGVALASAAVATVLTLSTYNPQQAGEVAASLLLSSVVSTAASVAVVGAVAYYYGPGLWHSMVDQVEPEEPAWRQYLDGWQQEVSGWPGEAESLMADYRQAIAERR